jgi:hypothetical protein
VKIEFRARVRALDLVRDDRGPCPIPSGYRVGKNGDFGAGIRDMQRFCEALFRTRTGDPLLTMEVLYQLS